MTLALVGANSDYTVMIADRRLTGGEKDDEFPKALVFSTPTLRVGVAFAGLARAPRFLMNFVLPSSLLEAAQKGPDPDDVVQALATQLDTAFASLPTSVTDEQKRTTVLLAGYRHGSNGDPQIFFRRVENWRSGVIGTEPFRVERFSERTNYVSAVGAWGAIPDTGREALADLISERKPPQAIVGKAVDVMRQAAQSEAAQDLIGGQLLSLVIPADPSHPAVGAYHTEHASDTVFFPGSVSVDKHGNGTAITDASLTSGAITEEEVKERYRRAMSGRPRDTTQRFPPIAIPKVGRNDPCPCGSGRKCKRCHGQ